MVTRYSCNFSGQCEKDHRGQYHSLEECWADCAGAENRDLLYKISTYDLDLLSELAPSDQAEGFYRLYRIRLDSVSAQEIVYYLTHNEINEDLLGILDDYPSLTPLIDSKFSVVRQIMELHLSDLFLPDYDSPLQFKYDVYGQRAEQSFQSFVTLLSNGLPMGQAVSELIYFLTNALLPPSLNNCLQRPDIIQRVTDVINDYLDRLKVWAESDE